MELCLDCISSIGLVPVDLTRVLFASAVSGKALGGYPGLSLVFHREPVEPAPDALPRYLDLGAWVQADGVPFTHSSNLILALRAALERAAPPEVFAERVRVSAWLRTRLVEIGYDVLGDERHAAPGVLTLVLPHSISSRRFGMRLEREGFLISYRSATPAPQLGAGVPDGPSGTGRPRGAGRRARQVRAGDRRAGQRHGRGDGGREPARLSAPGFQGRATDVRMRRERVARTRSSSRGKTFRLHRAPVDSTPRPIQVAVPDRRGPSSAGSRVVSRATRVAA
jgi:hypothetical protein